MAPKPKSPPPLSAIRYVAVKKDPDGQERLVLTAMLPTTEQAQRYTYNMEEAAIRRLPAKDRRSYPRATRIARVVIREEPE